MSWATPITITQVWVVPTTAWANRGASIVAQAEETLRRAVVERGLAPDGEPQQSVEPVVGGDRVRLILVTGAQ